MKSNKCALALLIIITSLPFISCNEDSGNTDVNLQFTLTYDGNPLVSFGELNYPLGYKVFFSKYSLYLSDITLLSSEGDHVLSNVEFIDLLTGIDSEQKALDGEILQYSMVPSRTYNGISFNIGVPETVNSTEPADYTVDSPLSNNGEYWVGWSSYIFHKIEGKMDNDDDGVPEAGIALHIGSDEAFRKVSVNQSLLIEGDEKTVKVNFDLRDILEIDGGFYDFQETPQVHHLGVLPKVLPILDNTMPGISIE